MDCCGVVDDRYRPYREALIESARQSDCQFADKCPEWDSCPMGEQHRTKPGINPLFLRPDHIFEKPSDTTYRILQ